MNQNQSHNRSFKVVVVGAGLGGLCLVHNLGRRGIDVMVYDRDSSPWDRAQGYRLHLDADGINALNDSLSAELFALFNRTATRARPFTTVMNTDLSIRVRRPHAEHGGTSETPHSGLPAHVNVNRATLRELLLIGLEGRVQFGKKVDRYVEDAAGVTVHFEDGCQVTADLVVGADGIHSRVRRQRAPSAVTQDSGVRAIYGRVPLTRAVQCVPQQAREDVFSVAIDERKCFLGLGPVIFPERPELANPALRPQDDYVVCIIGARRELYAQEDAQLRKLDPEALQQQALSLLAAWPETTRAIVAQADPASFFLVEMHTSVPTALATPNRVTLLGDAIHAMTPTLGRGANLALRDAALLGPYVESIANGTREASSALADYESAMLPYGFAVVREAAAMGMRLMGQEPLPT